MKKLVLGGWLLVAGALAASADTCTLVVPTVNKAEIASATIYYGCTKNVRYAAEELISAGTTTAGSSTKSLSNVSSIDNADVSYGVSGDNRTVTFSNLLSWSGRLWIAIVKDVNGYIYYFGYQQSNRDATGGVVPTDMGSDTWNGTRNCRLSTLPLTITVQSEDSELGSVSGGGSFYPHASETLTATPNVGCHFVQWEDGSTAVSRKVSAYKAGTYTATFAPNTYTVALDAQGGEDETASVTATYGSVLPKLATLPTRPGCKFKGYFDALIGGILYYDAGGIGAKNWDKTQDDPILYAHWEVNEEEVDDWKPICASGNGQTLGTNGRTVHYYLTADTVCSATRAGQSGLSIAEGATVYIYIPESVTLTATGAAGDGAIGGGAGILVPESSNLHLIGSGTVVATGGAAGNGCDGLAGGNGIVAPNGARTYYGGNGGAGGAGGGGAGAGIGTAGGAGGRGGAGGLGDGGAINADHHSNDTPGEAGEAGGTASAMGALFVQDGIAVTAVGGAAGSTGGVGGAAGLSLYDVGTGWGKNNHTAGGAGGGGGGGSGFAAANVGTGGAGGGGGGGGGGAYTIYSGNGYYFHTNSLGGDGGLGSQNGESGSDQSDKTLHNFLNLNTTITATRGDFNYVARPGGASGATGEPAVENTTYGTDDSKTYVVRFLKADGSDYGSGTYAVGGASTITLPTYAGHQWQNVAYGKACGTPSDLTSASTEKFTAGTINARNVYGDLAFMAVANNYTVTLDLAGGEGATSFAATYGQIPASIAVPMKVGRKFGGLFTELNGEGEQIFDEYGVASAPWVIDAEDTTLYAFWINELYASTTLKSVSYDFRAVKPAQVFKSETLTSSPTGWEADVETAAVLAAIGEGEFVAVVDPVTASSTVWTPQALGLHTLKHTTGGDTFESAQFLVTGFTYRVAFDANGGTGEAMTGTSLVYGVEGIAPACAYSRDDYLFDSWNTRKDGTGDSVAKGGAYSNLVTSADETGVLYAQWSIDPNSVVSYDVEVKGGEGQETSPVKVTHGWVTENLPGVDPDKVAEELEKTDPTTGLKKWQEFVVGVTPGDASAKIAIESPQQKESDKIKVTMKALSPAKGSGFAVKYRLDTKKGEADPTSVLSDSPEFDIDLSGEDPTGLYTVNVVFVPDGKVSSDEVVESVNTLGILKVPSPKTLEIVAVPWNELVPEDGRPISVANLVKKATLTDGDKLHVYDRAKKTYKSYLYHAAEQTWEALGVYKVTANGMEKTGGADEADETVARGNAVWLERQDSSKPFYLYGQYDANAVETKIEKNRHNLVASPTLEAFHLNGGKITGTINAKDQIIVPQGSDKPPKTYTYKSGTGWGYSKLVGERFKFDTTDDEVPAGTGFWYISKGGEPTIKW